MLLCHGGGLLVGSSEIIPPSQVQWLVTNGFVTVTPNYRLAPQVTAKVCFADCVEAYDWAVTSLVDTLRAEYGVHLDSRRTVAIGHSSGGTIALHLASCRPVKAVTAFYPSLYFSDTESSAHKAVTALPFAQMPDFSPSEDDWKLIAPSDRQLSEVPLAPPGSTPAPRNRWQMTIMKNGQWMGAISPDGDFAVVDPLTRLHAQWPPVMLVQGELDVVPGSSVELVRRAENDMKAARLQTVRVKVVEGEGHAFDLPPELGTTEFGAKWEAVLEGLQFLKAHV